MITRKQKELLKLIFNVGDITSKHGRTIYKTYAGFYRSVERLKKLGFVDEFRGLFGVRYFYIKRAGRKYIKDLNS